MGLNDPSFPVSSQAPMSSSLRKARIRANLFRTKVVPVRVGRFILVERLDAGAMGEIYTALDEQLDRRVALKLVRHGLDDDLLLREAQALAQVSHPNVVQIYETGTHEGRSFIAMELVHGQTLTRWLAAASQMPRRQRQREILRRFIAAGRGLEAIHVAGVTHRDFKPDNVVVGNDGNVRVVDLGLASVVIPDRALAAHSEPASGGAITPTGDLEHGETVRFTPEQPPADNPTNMDAPPQADGSATPPDAPRLTASVLSTKPGIAMGTLPYMAPEQMRGMIADHRSDQFSFCVALHHALTGEFPFSGTRFSELLASMTSGAPALGHSAGVKARLRKALRRGLSADPSQRFANMGELLSTIEPGMQRSRGWIASAVLLLVLLVVLWFQFLAPGDPCRNADSGIASSWLPEQQAAVHTAFSRSALPYAEAGWLGTRQRIDAYVVRWRQQAISTCQATNVEHTQSAQLFDRRMLCLAHARSRLAQLVSGLSAGGPDAIQHAVEATEALPDAEACGQVENMMSGLEPPSSTVAAGTSAARDQLASAQTLVQLGHSEEALLRAREVRTAADRLQYPPLRAEALTEVARALDGRGTSAARAEAESLYFDALDIAEAVRHDQLAVMIWSRLVLLASSTDPGMQRAHAWWRRYEAAVRRTGASAREQARLHHRLGEIYYRESKYAEAVDEETLAIGTISQVPELQLELSRYRDALARALERQGRLDQAIALHESAVRIASDALGASHPDVIKYNLNYGNALAKQGQYARARSVLEAALNSMPVNYRDSHLDAGKLHAFLSDLSYMEGKLDDAAAHGRESLRIYQNSGAPDQLRAEAYINLGNVESRRKRFAEALALYQNALTLRLPILGRDHYQVGVNEGSLADALVGLSRYGEAMDHVREAERIFALSSAHEQSMQAWIRTVHGEALVGLRQFSAAIPVLEAALPLFAGVPDPDNQPRALWALARALHALGEDPARVRRLAEEARALFVKLGAPEAGNQEAVKQFIERLAPGPASPGTSRVPSR